MPRSLYSMLIAKGRRRNFQLRCNLVFMIKKLFWLLGEKPIIVRRSWNGNTRPVMRLWLTATQARDGDSLDKENIVTSNVCHSFRPPWVHLLKMSNASLSNSQLAMVMMFHIALLLKSSKFPSHYLVIRNCPKEKPTDIHALVSDRWFELNSKVFLKYIVQSLGLSRH